MSDIFLSICIATLNRGDVIGETLASIVPQLTDEVELVVLDGASPDNTAQVVQPFADLYDNVRYVVAETNSGFDEDYDKVVQLGYGKYCWLMSDDDLFRPDAVARVLDAAREDRDVILVDAQIRTLDFSSILEHSRMGFTEDQRYEKEDAEKFFIDTCDHLTFVGALIIRRELWMQRDRQSYYRSWFIHTAVVFQSPAVNSAIVIAEPQLIIRFGNANWTARTFEIWMFIWPRLVHSFSEFSDAAKREVADLEPWRDVMMLLKHRAKNRYSLKLYRRFLAQRGSRRDRAKALLVALIPATLANFLAVLYVVMLNRKARLGLYDLLDSDCASWASHLLARIRPLDREPDMYIG